jgi:hypothetical protein
MPNYNRETGVSYGVIACASLDDWIYDEIDQMDCPGEQEAYAEFMRERAAELNSTGELTFNDLDCPDGEEDLALAEISDQDVCDLIDSVDPYYGQTFWMVTQAEAYMRAEQEHADGKQAQHRVRCAVSNGTIQCTQPFAG